MIHSIFFSTGLILETFRQLKVFIEISNIVSNTFTVRLIRFPISMNLRLSNLCFQFVSDIVTFLIVLTGKSQHKIHIVNN